MRSINALFNTQVRKIRCDGLPGGCSPCLQNNTECRTTDRITGRATQRGYVEGIEQQNRDLQQRVRELEQRLMQTGIDAKSANGFHDAASSSYEYNQSSTTQGSAWRSTAPPYTSQTGNGLTPPQREKNGFRESSTIRADSVGDNYLGISTSGSALSSINGTALSILGMTIDIADFMCDDMDEPDKSAIRQPLYNKSYQAFLRTAFNMNPPNKASFLRYDWDASFF